MSEPPPAAPPPGTARIALAPEQAQAANPTRSEWVSANAGSGKTSVLTARVARLLLAGVSPSRVLCLTFTRNATGEMKNRLFETLGRWAMLENEALIAELNGMREPGEPAFAPEDPAQLDGARRLFAQALEFPGGLRIQTIHAFSLALLRRFPFEAGLDPSIDLLDEHRTLELAERAFEDAVRQAHVDDGAFGQAYRTLIAGASDWQMRELRAAVIRHRIAYRSLLTLDEEAIAQALCNLLATNSSDPAATVAKSLGSADAISREFAPLLDAVEQHGSSSEQERFQILRDGLAAVDRGQPLVALQYMLRTLTTASGEPRKNMVTKAVRTVLEHSAEWESVEQSIQRLLDLEEQRRRAAVAQSSIAAAQFAKEYLRIYENLTAAEAGVDYDDIVVKACGLLLRSEVREWIRFRLDGGIDHVLVDEAQDTSPNQWEIIKSVTEEFFVGGDEPEMPRTVFAVGDEKQSIFSFQGARPELFEGTRQWYDQRLRQLGGELQGSELLKSYRSAPTILEFVDQTFRRESYEAENVDGIDASDAETWARTLLGWDRPPTHTAHHANQPGRVEVWDLFEPDDDDATAGGAADAGDADSPQLRMAAKVATRIDSWLNGPAPVHLPGTNRAIAPGDIMVLVQSRTEFVGELLRRLRLYGVPTAGADRIAVRNDLAVRDLLALADFALLPEDDHNLAVVLRSPFGGISDEDLFDLAHPREWSLWDSLQKQARRDATGELQVVVDFLKDMRDHVDHGAFEFLERALVLHNGRQKLVQRLGQDITEPVDELVSAALTFEGPNRSSLQEFVDHIRRSGTEIKTGVDVEQTRVRVMTVHAAKGLEAPIVIVPDALRMPNFSGRERIFIAAGDERELPIYVRRTGDDVEQSKALRETFAQREREEYYRSLYVALTRAKNWLVVGDALGKATRHRSWYFRVLSAAKRIGREIDPADDDLRARAGCLYPGWIVESQDPGAFFERPAETASTAIEVPTWARCDIAPPTIPREWLAPSSLANHSDSATAPQQHVEDNEYDGKHALDRGTLIHLLLERLPRVTDSEQRKALAANLVTSFGGGLPEQQAESVVAQALQIIDDPEFAWLFTDRVLPEVSFGAPGPGSELGIHGRMDCLIVDDKRVTVVDFKSDGVVPPEPQEVGQSYLAQLGAYRSAVGQVYPEQEVVTGILWTSGEPPRYMEFPDELVDEAFRQAIVARARTDDTEDENAHERIEGDEEG